MVGNRHPSGQPPSACVLEVSVRGVKISVQDQCRAAHRVGDPAGQPPSAVANGRLCVRHTQGEQCFHFFHLKNISFCGCHPKHSR